MSSLHDSGYFSWAAVIKRPLIVILAALTVLAVSTQADEWKKLTEGEPPLRDVFALAHDTARDVVVVHGGVTGQEKNSGNTWEFNGTAWRKVAENGPGRRHAPAMTYDSRRGVVLLVAGSWTENGEYRNAGDTWAWDGTKWEKLADDGPPASHGPTMTFDSGRGVAVYFGGFRARNLPGTAPEARRHDFSGQTWEWNGSAWSNRSEGGPAPRYGSAMAYDPVRGLTVLFGGRDHAGNEYTDTWAWDGQKWRQIDAKEPRSTTGHVLIWQNDIQRCVLLGGLDLNAENPPSPVKEMWTWNGKKWERMGAELPGTFSWPVATSAPGGGILLVGHKEEGAMETWLLRDSGPNQ